MIHFLSAFPPFRGGISKFSDYLYKEISQREDIIAWNFKKLYPNLLFPGISQYLKEGETYSNRLIHSFNPLSWPVSKRKIKAKSEDVLVYSHWHPFFIPSMNAHISGFKKNGGGKVVGLFHNVIPHEKFPFQKRLLSRLLQNTDQAIVLSGQTHSELLQISPSTSVHQIFHPVYEQSESPVEAAELREKYNIAKDEFVVLFFGLIRQYKGLDILIQAFNRMDIMKQKIRPLIVGEFYLNKKDILKGISADDYEHYIVMDKFVSDEVMAEVFKIADVTVLPYTSASQSGILSNAINFKVPAIVSDLPGLTEFVEHEKHGIVLKDALPETLAAAIDTARDESHQQTWRNNLDELKKKYSWEAFTSELLAILHS